MEPKIRLKGFRGEWETKNIASVASLKAGSSIDTSQEISYPSQGYYPCYGGNGLRGYVRDYTHDGIYNIIGRQGALCGNVKMATGKFHATEHAVVVTPTRQLDPYFLFNVLTKANINQYATGVAQPGLSVQNVNKSLFINIPEFDEQKAIGAYFQHLDSLIQSTTKKIESLKQVKAASLQSMFPQEGETTPRVRFKGFDGEWSICSLKDFAKKSTEKNTSMEYTITLTNSAEYGVINQRDFFDHDISNDDHINGYYVIHNGDFVYNPRVSTSAPVGPINRNLLGYSGVMSPLYLIFKVDGINKDFLSYYFKTSLWHNYMKLEGNTGARFDRLAISDEQFFNMPIYVPENEKEQSTIASYFTNLESQITLQTQRLEKLKQIKSACLDNMFV